MSIQPKDRIIHALWQYNDEMTPEMLTMYTPYNVDKIALALHVLLKDDLVYRYRGKYGITDAGWPEVKSSIKNKFESSLDWINNARAGQTSDGKQTRLQRVAIHGTVTGEAPRTDPIEVKFRGEPALEVDEYD